MVSWISMTLRPPPPPPPAKTKPRTEIKFVWTHAQCDYKHAHRISYRMRCNQRQQQRPTWPWIRSWIDILQLHSILVIFWLWTQLLAHSLFFFLCLLDDKKLKMLQPTKELQVSHPLFACSKKGVFAFELSSDGRIAQSAFSAEPALPAFCRLAFDLAGFDEKLVRFCRLEDFASCNSFPILSHFSKTSSSACEGFFFFGKRTRDVWRSGPFPLRCDVCQITCNQRWNALERFRSRFRVAWPRALASLTRPGDPKTKLQVQLCTHDSGLAPPFTLCSIRPQKIVPTVLDRTTKLGASGLELETWTCWKWSLYVRSQRILCGNALWCPCSLHTLAKGRSLCVFGARKAETQKSGRCAIALAKELRTSRGLGSACYEGCKRPQNCNRGRADSSSKLACTCWKRSLYPSLLQRILCENAQWCPSGSLQKVVPGACSGRGKLNLERVVDVPSLLRRNCEQREDSEARAGKPCKRPQKIVPSGWLGRGPLGRRLKKENLAVPSHCHCILAHRSVDRKAWFGELEELFR